MGSAGYFFVMVMLILCSLTIDFHLLHLLRFLLFVQSLELGLKQLCYYYLSLFNYSTVSGLDDSVFLKKSANRVTKKKFFTSKKKTRCIYSLVSMLTSHIFFSSSSPCWPALPGSSVPRISAIASIPRF